MLDAVKAEYMRRGQPMSYTGWDIPTVRKFMTARMNRLRKGEEVGVYAKDLPKRSAPHKPAPLPSWALSESEGEPEAEESEESEEEDDGLTDSGYSVQKSKNKYYLVHKVSRQKVEIGDPEPEHVWVVTTEGGVDYLGQGNSEVWDEIACREHMGIILQETSERKPKDVKPPQSVLKGMVPKSGQDSKSQVPGKHSKANKPAAEQSDKEDEFGESSDDEEATQIEEGESNDALRPFIYKEEESGKMYLVDPHLGRELKLPTDKPYDWEVSAGKKDDSGFTRYLLKSKSKKDSDKDVAVIMAGRKVKDVEHPDRLQQVQKAKDKDQEDKNKKKPKSAMTREETEKDMRDKIEKEMRTRLEAETRTRLEKEMREEADRKKAAQEEADREKAAQEEADRQKAAQEEADRQKAAQEEADRKKAAQEEADRQKAAQEEADRKKAAQDKIDQEAAEKKKRDQEAAKAKADEEALKARIEKETREKIENELREQIQKEMAEKNRQENTDKEPKEAEEKEGEEGKAANIKTEAEGSEVAKKAEDSDHMFGGLTVKEFMDQEVTRIRKKRKDKFLKQIREREDRKAKAQTKTKVKAKASRSAQDSSASVFEPALPQVPLD